MKKSKISRSRAIGLLSLFGLIGINASWNFEALQQLAVEEFASVSAPACSNLSTGIRHLQTRFQANSTQPLTTRLDCGSSQQTSTEGEERLRADLERKGEMTFEKVANEAGSGPEQLQVRLAIKMKFDSRRQTEAGRCYDCQQEDVTEEDILISANFDFPVTQQEILARMRSELENATLQFRDNAFSSLAEIAERLREDRIDDITARIDEILSEDCSVEAYDLSRIRWIVSERISSKNLSLSDTQTKLPSAKELERAGIEKVTDANQKAECMTDRMASLDDKEQSAYFFDKMLPHLNTMIASGSAAEVAQARTQLDSIAKRTRMGGAAGETYFAEIYHAAAGTMNFIDLNTQLSDVKDFSPAAVARLTRNADLLLGQQGRQNYGVTAANLPKAHQHLSGLHQKYTDNLRVASGAGLPSTFALAESGRSARAGEGVSSLAAGIIEELEGMRNGGRTSITTAGIIGEPAGFTRYQNEINGRSGGTQFTRTRTVGLDTRNDRTGLGNSNLRNRRGDFGGSQIAEMLDRSGSRNQSGALQNNRNIRTLAPRSRL